ncbi:Gfo/Idh/MocA family protein [Paenibacillus eucommiae]|uniref:Dehydrogenase n=1 Tax=Paenibacillus eucommiae TaxID=1355755 RepID=A0ABS4JAH8_9BACL|nr:Gfo/Idh/MocA family oxidoreductase [Paenibacillus eucommiae]MBP1996845.1 putative dehydrogenase [Paenibacillus eucommiae]
MINIAVIGYGFRGKVLSNNILKLNENVRITAIMDTRNEEIRKDLGELADPIRFYDTVDELLDHEKLDGVIISTRCSSHTRVAVKVMQKGIPCILEKPVATNMEDLMTLKSAYESSGTEVAVPFSLRLSPLGQAAKEIADSGKLGSIEHVQAINNVSYGSVYFQNWYRDDKETGGLFLQKATHDFDLIQYILGLKPVWVSAVKSKQIFKGNKQAGLKCEACEEQHTCLESAVLHRKKGEPVHGEMCCFATDTGNEDSGSAIIEYESGMHASYSQNFFARNKAGTRTFRFLGYKGTMEFDYYTNRIQVFMHHTNRVETYDIPPGNDSHGGGDIAVCQSLLDTITQGVPSQTPLEEAMVSALLCLKATSSAETRISQEVKWTD